MTPEEKAKAKEQAAIYTSQIPAAPKPPRKPRPDKGKPRQARALPDFIYLRHYFSGQTFYRVQVKRNRRSHHVGSFATVPEAVRRLAQWLERNPV